MNLRHPYQYTLVLLPFLQKESPKVSPPQSCHSPNTRPSHSDHSNTHWLQLTLLSFNVHVLGAAQTLSVEGPSPLASAQPGRSLNALTCLSSVHLQKTEVPLSPMPCSPLHSTCHIVGIWSPAPRPGNALSSGRECISFIFVPLII